MFACSCANWQGGWAVGVEATMDRSTTAPAPSFQAAVGIENGCLSPVSSVPCFVWDDVEPHIVEILDRGRRGDYTGLFEA